MVSVGGRGKGGDDLCGCIGGVVVSKGNVRWGVFSGSGGGGGGGGERFWGSGKFSRVVAVDGKY